MTLKVSQGYVVLNPKTLNPKPCLGAKVWDARESSNGKENGKRNRKGLGWVLPPTSNSPY